MTDKLRRLVSGKKIRYSDSQSDIDLDLAYINRRMIAMGFPSTGISSTYRNPAVEVAALLEREHPNHYKVYNLTESPYGDSVFQGPSEHFPFPDHHAPPFNLLIQIQKSIKEWLDSDEDNVIAVHCLAGMGRTGTVISCAMILAGNEKNAETALCHFAHVRTGTDKGVKIPSQIRYVYYFDEHLKRAKEGGFDWRLPITAPKKMIKRISISYPMKEGRFTPVLMIFDSAFDIIWNSAWISEVKSVHSESIEFMPLLEVAGDFTIKLYKVSKGIQTSLTEILRTSHNTAFCHDEVIILNKEELDGPHKDALKGKKAKLMEDMQLCIELQKM